MATIRQDRAALRRKLAYLRSLAGDLLVEVEAGRYGGAGWTPQDRYAFEQATSELRLLADVMSRDQVAGTAG